MAAVAAVAAVVSLVVAAPAGAVGFPQAKPVRPGVARPIAYVPISFAGEPALRRGRVLSLARDVRARFAAESEGRLRFASLRSAALPGDVLPALRIPAGIDRCDDFAVVDQVLFRTRADLTRYAHVVVLYPGFTGCNWGGRAGLPGATVAASPEIEILVHELGHNIGLDHARTLDCAASDGWPTSLGTRCGGQEYGDIFDVMGATFGSFSTWGRAAVRLIPRQRARAARATGRYALALPDATSGTVVLRIPRTPARATPDRSGICLERLRASDIARSGSRDGLLVRLCAPLPQARGVIYGLPGTWLVDASPGDDTKQLDVGAVLEDPAGRVRIRVDALRATRAIVSVAVGGDALPAPTAVPVAPVVTATPSVTEIPPGEKGKLPYQREVDVTLTWTQPAGGAPPVAYHVLRAGRLVGVVDPATTTWRDPIAPGPGAAVRYRVRAIADGGGRATSAAATAAALALPGQPAAPTGLRVTVRNRAATVSWPALPAGGPALGSWLIEQDGVFVALTLPGRRRYTTFAIQSTGVTRLRVRAVAANGTPGPWSAPIVARVAPRLEGVIRRPQRPRGPIVVDG